MKVTEYKNKLEQKKNPVNRHLPEIPKYQQVTKQLWEALQGDIVWGIMRSLGLDKTDDKWLRAKMEGDSLRVTEKVVPHLYKLFHGVQEKLHLEHAVDYYVVSDTTLNAGAYVVPPVDPNSPYIVQINSAMIETMTETELCSVIGHELGHLLDENLVLDQVIHFLFPCDQYGFPMVPIPLRYKYFFWKQLSELFADRYGYLATEDIKACITSEFKLKSGLKLDKMEVDMEAFMEDNREALQHFTTGQGISLRYGVTHPVSPIRIEALNLFANAKTEAELNEGMNVLVDAIARINGNDMAPSALWYVASAGLIMANADGEITHDELENILDNMSEYYMFPTDILKQITVENSMEIFTQSMHNLVENNPEVKNNLFMYLVDIMVTDYKFKKEEVNLLFKIGKEVFEYDEQTIVRLLASGIQMGVMKGYKPTTLSIS